eukprot:CAMPEP_0178917258 /NCGR_PEP_ID=MMETSP0786-20121207/13144_1 /TAXON_ID=186022 /ORGANISM="Thalassionema frauenfeldii, Strain CCMP 1798" /LENGTH=272 /DNA_ID=CAMNT_0020590783 /DNA_START=69 /DNA_END=887 /DNA_ORIENTATION=+
MKFQVTIEAQGLKRVSILRIGSPYALVKICGGPREGEVLGETEPLEDCLDPRWSTAILVETEATKMMPIRIEIIDSEDDKVMGEAEFEVISVYHDEAHTQFHEPRGGTRIQVTVVESLKGSVSGMMSMQFRMLDVKNVESGILGLGRSDPFVELQKRVSKEGWDEEKWIVAYRTYHETDNLRPVFDEFRIPMENLCYCDKTWPLRLVCYDWQRNGKHRVIGLVETTVAELMEKVSKNGNADRSNALSITKEGKTKSEGLIVMLKANIKIDDH